MPLDPITLYKDGISRRIPAIDAPGWIAKGWLKEPPDQILPPVVSTLALDPLSVPFPQEPVVIDSAASSTLGASETQSSKRGGK